MDGLVVSLCDHSGVMVKPWRDAGYRCLTVDLLHPEGITKEDGIYKYGVDVTRLLPDVVLLMNPRIIFAFPPCTHTAVSGARWFQSKGPKAAAEAFSVLSSVKEICERSGVPWMIENPVSTFSTYWRKPDYTFDPCDYGDPYTKKTCLWTGGGFVMPEKNRVEPTEGSKMHLMPPSEDRQQLRSVTPEGFAKAVYEANG